MEASASPVVRTVAHRLLIAFASEQGVWTLHRAREAAGADVSPDTCACALGHLEQIGAVVQREPGIWQLDTRWRGTQADWYT